MAGWLARCLGVRKLLLYQAQKQRITSLFTGERISPKIHGNTISYLAEMSLNVSYFLCATPFDPTNSHAGARESYHCAQKQMGNYKSQSSRPAHSRAILHALFLFTCGKLRFRAQRKDKKQK